MAKSVKIRLLCSMAGESVLAAGAVIETTIEEAQSLMSAGYAELFVEVETAESKASKSKQVTSKKKKK